MHGVLRACTLRALDVAVGRELVDTMPVNKLSRRKV